MLRFVRTLALAMAGFGVAAGSTGLVEGVLRPAAAQTVQAEDARGAKAAKSSRRTAKSNETNADGEAKSLDAEAVLDKARRALADGKAETAFGLADSVINNAKKDPRNTARALAVRGEANLRQGRPAEALADLDSALWVKGGLAGSEREGATRARAQAMQQSGLGGNTGSAGVAAPPRRIEAAEKPAAASSSSGGLTGFFSGIFGGGGNSQPSGESARAPSTTAASAPPRQVEPSVSSYEPQRSDEPARPAARAAQPKAGRIATAVTAAPRVPAPPSASGSYRIQLAAVRNRAEAEAMAQRVRREQAAVLGQRSFEVIEEVYGNMGRFYRVRIGAFDHPTEASAICATLRQKQVDCMMLEQ